MKNREIHFLEDINRHRGILHKIARTYCQDKMDQDDLIQEMTIQLWNSYDTFRKESQFSTWLYRVCLNTAILFYKKAKKNQNELFQYQAGNSRNIEESEFETEVSLAALYQSFRYLDKIEKALIFQYLEGLSNKEIASNLGISEINARVKLYRTREKIKTIIIKYRLYEV